MFDRFASAFVIGLSLCTAPLANAQTAPASEAVYDAIGMPEMIQVMSLEGRDYGNQIAIEMFPNAAGGAEWEAVVAAIYDPQKMSAQVRQELATALQGADTAAIVSFFESDLGRNIVGLEVAARRAFLDKSVEETAKETAAIAMMDDTPRHRQIAEFVTVNDLIDTNVVSALNANYAFYMGLLDGGAFPGALSEDEILNNVWMSEPEVRSSTSEWVYSFLTLSYQPLSETELDAYIAFSKTDAGKDLNRAMFAAFDGVFSNISRALGRAASQMTQRQEL